MSAILHAPKLTLPPDEALCVGEAYEAAEVILEYGSGGSTVMAGAMPDKTVFSVESDPKWLADMVAWFAANPPRATVHMHHGDIGPTKAWGHPVNDASFRAWPSYPLSVWHRPDFRHPDVVLIDGRFRAACFLAAQFLVTRPTTVLIDDYIDRGAYHKVTEIAGEPEMIGRMARFQIIPRPVPPERLLWIMETFLRPL